MTGRGSSTGKRGLLSRLRIWVGEKYSYRGLGGRFYRGGTWDWVETQQREGERWELWRG